MLLYCSCQAQLTQAAEDATDLHQALGDLRQQLQAQIDLVQQGNQTKTELQVQQLSSNAKTYLFLRNQSLGAYVFG